MTTKEEDIPQYTGPAEYRGPTMGHLMKTHTLADQIVATHKLAPANILDGSGLALLRAFVADPAAKLDLLRDRGMLDEPGEKAGTTAQALHGSLVGYAIATDAFDEREIGVLKTWFASGELDEELVGVDPTGKKS